jgi:hypothetical protein
MNTGFLQSFFPCEMICNLSPVVLQQRLRQAHHLLAKLQWKIRCSTISSGGLWQIIQLYPELSIIFLLLNIFLVFNLSEMSNQQKNFIFGVHLDFHSHPYAAWAVIFLKQYW